MASLTQIKQRFWNNDGTIAAGGKVYVYLAGTTTPTNSYTDATGGTPNTNPVILDSKGEAAIFTDRQVKLNVLQSDNVQITGYPMDYTGQVYANVAGSASQTFDVANATSGTHAVNRTTGDARYATIDAQFPTGTRMLFNQTTAPTGWTKDTTAALNDTALRIVTGAVGSGGSNAFSTAAYTPTISNTFAVGSHTLTTAEMPSHKHDFVQYDGSYGTLPYQVFPISSNDGATQGLYGAINMQSVGGGGGHVHPLTGSATSSAITLGLKYNDVIIASKN